MRENIGLFRGKRIDNGEWISGSLFTRINDCYINPLPIITSKSKVDPDTVGECTGLRDKNGKLIFEGDIVNGFNDLHQRLETYKVKWAWNNGFYFVDDCETEWHPEHIENAEVIGNIHDTPELMKEGADE